MLKNEIKNKNIQFNKEQKKLEWTKMNLLNS
jgi:hypothetical protein